MDEANELRGSLQLIGTVKSVIFQNEENGYTVLRLDVGGDEPVTVVGCLPFAAPGEGLTVEGAWERHPSHGEQFKASSAMRSLPVGEKHIYEYLASGAVRGIGPATAAVLVNRFGSRTLEILSDSPEKLAEIKGISARRARDISETFRRQTGMRLLMEFLAANGLKPEYAMRLYKLYGDEFIAKAFKYAHEADPSALLFYNDYNASMPTKRDRIYNMVKKMQIR